MKKAYFGVMDVLARWFGSGGILAYHGVGSTDFFSELHISAATLADQLDYANHEFSVLPLSEMVERLRTGKSTKGCLSITFDDAYLGVVKYAAPLFRERSIPATIFVTLDGALNGGGYWWDAVEQVRVADNPDGWEAMSEWLGLGKVDRLSTIATPTVRSSILSRHQGRGGELVRAIGPYSSNATWRSASFDELDSLADDPHFDFAPHSVSHAALPTLTQEEQRREIAASFRGLQERLPRVRPFIAYPYGLFDGATIAAAHESGMAAGFSIEPRPPGRSDSIFDIPRLCVRELTHTSTIYRVLSPPSRMIRLMRSGRYPEFPEQPAERPH